MQELYCECNELLSMQRVVFIKQEGWLRKRNRATDSVARAISDSRPSSSEVTRFDRVHVTSRPHEQLC